MITVIGSINVDLVVKIKSMVLPGETILAKESLHFPGGKGANQALACARLGGDTAFVGKVGNDSHAEMALSLLSKSPCKLHVSRLDGASTGLALIMLDENGENSIVVSPGANHLWPETDDEMVHMLGDTAILVLQLEIPIDVVKRLLTIAKRTGVTTVLNCSPVDANIRDALPLVDLLLMNTTEAEYFTGEAAKPTPEYGARIRSLGAGEAIVTLGSDGALIFQADEISHVPAWPADVVDTTAAGDTYTGALVSRLSTGHDLKSAAKYASCAAAIAVSRLGAQPSIPAQSEVESVLDRVR